MGKSKSIAKQQKLNKEFQQYIDEMSSNMDQRQEALGKELEAMEEEHYKQYPDKAILIDGNYSHLTTMSEWTLKSVESIIDSCSKAIFGADTPEGSEKEKTSEEVSKSVMAMTDLELYIAKSAFSIIQGVIGSFSDLTSTSVEKKVDGKPIAPGMTLFIGVENNAYSSKGFLKSDEIVQTIFVYKVYYSIEEGKAQSALSDLQMYEDQKTAFRKQIEAVTQEISELDPAKKNFKNKLIQYKDNISLLEDCLDEITAKIKELKAKDERKDKYLTNRIINRAYAAIEAQSGNDELSLMESEP